MAASSTNGLARAIRALAPAYLQSGRVEALYRYILALSPSYIDKEPDFFLYQGHALVHWGRAEEAIACYERACTLYEDRGESKSLPRADPMSETQTLYRELTG